MSRKMAIIGFVLFMAAMLGLTLLSWAYPDRPAWQSWGTALMVIAGVWVYVLLARKKKTSPPV